MNSSSMACDLCKRDRESESPHPMLCISCSEAIKRLLASNNQQMVAAGKGGQAFQSRQSAA